MYELSQVVQNKESVFAAINPFAFMVDEIHSVIDRETLELSISQGYESVKSLMNNCQSCQEMFKNMNLQFVSGDELFKILKGEIVNMEMLNSGERNESLGYAALLYVDDKSNITLIGGFSINK